MNVMRMMGTVALGAMDDRGQPYRENEQHKQRHGDPRRAAGRFGASCLERILRENEWNISKTARDLDIDRQTLYNKIAKYGIDQAGGQAIA